MFLNGISNTLYAVGGLGALVAAVAGITMLLGPRAE
jgi:hypothetical protein